MADQTTKYEQHRQQLVATLTSVADSMRKCADVAETFANFVNTSATNPNSPVTRVLVHKSGNSKTDQDVAASENPKKKRKAVDATDEGSDEPKKKKKRNTKPKDPNAPRRPASSYILFQNDVRGEIKASHPNISNTELLAIISKQWQEMSEEDKAVYHRAQEHAKEQYTKDKQAYDNRTQDEIDAANAAIADAAIAAAATKKKPRGRSAKTSAPEDPAPPPPAKTTPPETSPSSEGSEPSESDESEEEGDDDNNDEVELSEEEEKPVFKKPNSKVTRGVTPGKKKSA